MITPRKVSILGESNLRFLVMRASWQAVNIFPFIPENSGQETGLET